MQAVQPNPDAYIEFHYSNSLRPSDVPEPGQILVNNEARWGIYLRNIEGVFAN